MKQKRNREQIGSNNSDSNPPRLPLDLLPLTMTPRMCFYLCLQAREENMAVEPMRPVGFFFKPSDYWTACKLSSRCHQHDFLRRLKTLRSQRRKLEKMEADDGSDQRLKMAVLYFLTRVIRGRKRNAYFIEPFILQAWTFPGFVTPLEILAFECIPVLRESFRDPDPNCLPDCPRMCKWKYKRTRTTGFALEEIYKALGNTKVISSTLKPQGDELDLLYEIMDEGSVEDVELQDDSDKADIAVDGWNRILIEPEGKIFWEDLFEMDVRNRPTTQQQSEPHGIFEGQEEERVGEEPEAGGEAGRESVKELELRLNKRMDDGFALRDETIRLLAARVKELEQDKIQRENWSFQFGEYETCEASGGKGRDNMGNGNEDGEAVAEKDGEKQVEEEAEKNGTKEAEKDGAKEAETTPEDAESEEEADKDGKNSESDAITAAVHTPLPTETTPEDAEGEEEAAKEAYEVAGNEDEVGQKEGETEADKEGETEEGKTDVEDSPSTLQVMAEAAEKLEKEVDDKAAAEKAADELAAADKAASDKEKVGDEEEIRPKRTHKPSRPLRSPYQKN
ncbi:hypothetical protein Bca52824_065219 [Brassica carinata]|uniref:DUF287 domain-containing protein n=1 Tax=Brassica carinata TaxID=52824 RepID=A0A8X7QHU9_BRACI|nr:hypothetical protein Bca52824_065219 [Brassica carinata]